MGIVTCLTASCRVFSLEEPSFFLEGFLSLGFTAIGSGALVEDTTFFSVFFLPNSLNFCRFLIDSCSEGRGSKAVFEPEKKEKGKIYNVTNKKEGTDMSANDNQPNGGRFITLSTNLY